MEAKTGPIENAWVGSADRQPESGWVGQEQLERETNGPASPTKDWQSGQREWETGDRSIREGEETEKEDKIGGNKENNGDNEDEKQNEQAGDGLRIKLYSAGLHFRWILNFVHFDKTSNFQRNDVGDEKEIFCFSFSRQAAGGAGFKCFLLFGEARLQNQSVSHLKPIKSLKISCFNRTLPLKSNLCDFYGIFESCGINLLEEKCDFS